MKKRNRVLYTDECHGMGVEAAQETLPATHSDTSFLPSNPVPPASFVFEEGRGGFVSSLGPKQEVEQVSFSHPPQPTY